MQVAVIGAGTMGLGIAHQFALYHHEVHMVDVSEEALDRAMQQISQNMNRQVNKGILNAAEREEALSRIHPFTRLESAVQGSALVVEAASENPTVKTALFRELDQHCDPGCILASNTSSISITRLAAATRRPQQVIGMHFMNPVPVMKLVEVVRGFSTSESCTQVVEQLARDLGKVPCTVQDYPGFISNRILMPMINEAIYALQEGVGTVESIDQIMKLGMSHPMGPLELADFIGLDVCLAILQVLQEGFGSDKYAPCPLLVTMVQAGALGVKRGQGFYSYGTDRSDKTPMKRWAAGLE